MAVTQRVRGILPDGTAVTEYVLTNENGMKFAVWDHGCTSYKLVVPTRQGPRDVLLGYKSASSYTISRSCHGALVGRVANRIRGGAFTLNGQEYQLPNLDRNGNHLHGVFPRRRFRVAELDNGVQLSYHSPDGEDGFPGKLRLKVTITLSEENVLRYDLRAVCDKDTLCNITNHNYYKLDDEPTVRNYLLQVEADRYLPKDETGAPDGRVLPVEGTPFDFRTPKAIGQDIAQVPGGYDHCFCLNGQGLRRAATVFSEKSGVCLEFWTTQPGAQLYTAAPMGRERFPSKSGEPWQSEGGFAFECQGWPAAPNFPDFPSIVLKAGETYHQIIELRFSVKE